MLNLISITYMMNPYNCSEISYLFKEGFLIEFTEKTQLVDKWLDGNLIEEMDLRQLKIFKDDKEINWSELEQLGGPEITCGDFMVGGKVKQRGY